MKDLLRIWRYEYGIGLPVLRNTAGLAVQRLADGFERTEAEGVGFLRFRTDRLAAVRLPG